MSTSSLWVMDPAYVGYESDEYSNSWWFSPIVWDVLLDKYMHDEIQTEFGYTKGLIGPGGGELHRTLNIKMNESDNISDRICWELSQQQVFFTKDKQLVSDAIKEFCSSNTEYHIHEGEKASVLTFEHIIERFTQIAEDILAIDEEQHPFFVFKNTSVDDNVDSWFSDYDEEEDEPLHVSLRQHSAYLTEFVIIEDDKITGFLSNLDYFKQLDITN